ncbi:MAG: hypothetical protein Q4D79_07525 [Propionibacteriaceae bacterium]|nr:hypothetical protein [Propionibacteriaceae bacterium]
MVALGLQQLATFAGRGLLSWPNILLVLAFGSFGVFVALDAVAAVRSGWPKKPIWALLPLAAWGAALFGLYLAFQPIHQSAAAPTGAARTEVILGEVRVSVHGDTVSGQGPTGSWSYRHANSRVSAWPDPEPPSSAEDPTDPRLIPSPDGRFIAVSFAIPFGRHVVTLESESGRVAAEATLDQVANAQLTNDVLLLGQDAYSLANGEKLWHSDAIPLNLQSRTATETHFITGVQCEGTAIRLCTLALLSQDGPQEGATRTVMQVLGDGDTTGYDQFGMARGWVVRQTAPGYTDPETSGTTIVQAPEAEAYHLDTGETVPLGSVYGSVADFERELGFRMSDHDQPLRFNPETREVQE